MKVCILYPWMPDYRIDFFRELEQRGLRDNVAYQIFAGSPPRELGNPDAQNFVSEFHNVRSIEIRLFNRSLIYYRNDKSWKDADAMIVEQSVRSLNTWIWSYLMKPKRLAMWGHGRTYTKSKAQFEERLKERLTLRSDWFFAYTEGGKNHLLEVGYPAKNISVINNSSPSTLKLRDIYLSTNDIDAFSQSFELAGKRVAVFIGAFSADKRIDFLLDAAQQIQRTIPNFVLVFFGEGPEKSKIVEASKQFPFIKFAHYADLKTLKLIGQVADVILMPGRVGLIAVDSFAIATPIVTTNFGFHAPEFEYLKNEVNCVITHDTLKQYVSGVTDLLQDSSRLTDLSAQCAKDCSNYSIETMASRFHEGVMALLKAPVKSSHK